jgi:hypothetical protein
MGIIISRQNTVGRFFEVVGHELFGGELVRNGDGDICLWKSDTTVEIKSSGHQSSYGFRLDVGQIEHYERISNFPFSHAWYVFFAYRNRRRPRSGGKRVTELSVYIKCAGHKPLSRQFHFVVRCSGSLYCWSLERNLVALYKECAWTSWRGNG